MEKNIVVSINGIGTVEVDNKFATFSLILKSKGETLESSNSQAKEKAAEAQAHLTKFNMQLDGEMAIDFANYKLEHREGNEKYNAGYQTLSSIRWTCLVD